jgi:hypothetical protein
MILYSLARDGDRRAPKLQERRDHQRPAVDIVTGVASPPLGEPTNLDQVNLHADD